MDVTLRSSLRNEGHGKECLDRLIAISNASASACKDGRCCRQLFEWLIDQYCFLGGQISFALSEDGLGF